MKNQFLEHVESKCKKTDIAYFEVGDTVEVGCKIKEGDKVRIQVFTGTVISRAGQGMSETFTVRRMVDEEGVERRFPIHSVNIDFIRPIRSGQTRRAKLFYLRDRTGKSVKLSHRHSEHTLTK